ncbi:MAG: protein kinase, partial [Acidobacteria bacterium]|nr:protein kinase [Acidobacteriota bacterium]
WQEIKDVFQSALGHEPEQRSAWLDKACSSDAEMRGKVEAMLQAHEEAGSFIVAPAAEVAAELMADEQTETRIGKDVGPYRIVSRLGAGGMGEVYLAQDHRLGRQVALKLLPDYFTTDASRVKRFKQEARAASAISHPNIATLYDIGDVDGVSYIAMEYVQGETLAAKIQAGSLDSTQVIDIGIQVADALKEAHKQSIIHRDIKSGNIMITPDGHVKVVDFGLARVARTEEAALSGDGVLPATTEPGLVMGTVAYMSPEQALGRATDQRTDLFSLGVVLYEMTTGRLPFSGASTSETIDKIVHAQPEALARFNYTLAPRLEQIIRKCLEKEPDRRYQSARDLSIDLKNLKRDQEAGTAGERWSSRRRVALARLTIVTLALAGAGIYWFNGRGEAIDSIAVMPFANTSGDPNLDYLGDGISESITSSLSALPELKVIARISLSPYRGRDADPRALGRELGVRALLTGQVVHNGENISIVVELVDTRDNRRIWGERYNRNVRDILVVQETISREISEKLRLRLTGDEKIRLTKRYTDNTEAYRYYLKGRFYFNNTTVKDRYWKSIEYYNKAIQIDPNYALAYSGLADSYELLTHDGNTNDRVPASESMPRARAAALKALEIDDTLAEAHTSLGLIKVIYDWDFTGAEKEFKRAIELNPSYPYAHVWYGLYLTRVKGQVDEGIVELNRGLELDPFSRRLYVLLVVALNPVGRYDQVIVHMQRALEFYEFGLFHEALGRAYEGKGLYEAALAEYGKANNQGAIGRLYASWGKKGEARKVIAGLEERLKESDDVGVYLILAEIHTALGERDRAVGWLKKLDEQSKGPPWESVYRRAKLWVDLGEIDRAFQWLERAYLQRPYRLAYINTAPGFDGIRSDPRFADLLRRIGLPPISSDK